MVTAASPLQITVPPWSRLAIVTIAEAPSAVNSDTGSLISSKPSTWKLISSERGLPSYN